MLVWVKVCFSSNRSEVSRRQSSSSIVPSRKSSVNQSRRSSVASVSSDVTVDEL